MSYFTATLGSASLLAVIYTFYVLANLSRRYGQVIGMPPYYRGFYVSMGLLAAGFVSHLIQDSVIISPDNAPRLFNADWFYVLTYYVPSAVAITVALGVGWRYWSWILGERHE